MTRGPGTILTALAALIGVALIALPDSAGATEGEAPAPVFAAKGEQTCMKCHDGGEDVYILKTPHSVKGDSRTPFAQHGCESCHGASADHIRSAARVRGDEQPILPAVRFVGKDISPVAERNKVCLGCHENGLRMNWRGSQHEANDVACTDCHRIHIAKDPVQTRVKQAETCFGCHAEQRAESQLFSHHPITEGKVICSDCHNPHGAPGPKLLKEFTVNDTCFGCHAEKRGPFLWEHEPVRDDCTNCHTPHGSTEARLLKERPPYLCASCHQESDHQASPWSGNVVAGLKGNLASTFTQGAAATQMLQRGCANCHSEIHGSNSQAGAFLTR